MGAPSPGVNHHFAPFEPGVQVVLRRGGSVWVWSCLSASASRNWKWSPEKSGLIVFPRPFLVWNLFTVKRSLLRYFLCPPFPGFPFFLKGKSGFLIVDVPPCSFVTLTSWLQRLCFIHPFFCLERFPFWAGVRLSRSVSELEDLSLLLLLTVGGGSFLPLLLFLQISVHDCILRDHFFIRARI